MAIERRGRSGKTVMQSRGTLDTCRHVAPGLHLEAIQLNLLLSQGPTATMVSLYAGHAVKRV